MKQIVKKTISILLIIIATALFSLSLYIKNKFGNAKIEQLLMSMEFAKGTSENVILNAFKYCVPITLILSLILIFIMHIYKYKGITYLKFKIKKLNKEIKLRIFPFNTFGYNFFICILITMYSINSLGIFAYLKNQTEVSTIFEDYYINPSDIKIEFPKNKKNLIYIYLESMEMGYTSMNFNEKNTNLIPNLETIAKKNLNFSNSTNLGGSLGTSGTMWTIAGTVAQTAGIPLKLIIDGNSYDHYSNFLPGVVTIGDILEKNGYKNYYLIGSDANFGGRDIYFKNHGNYEILDYNWALENKKIPKDYQVFWGYEDKKLFEIAKEELTNISKKDEPFNFTMLTVDTHAIDGYLDETCESNYGYQYADVISCSDSMIMEFIKWLEKQDFYKNTTIILSGDHLTMQSEMENFYNIQPRTIYNAFINSEIKPSNNTERVFTSFDMFPTTLASLGVKIEGNKLGFGTNLFSDERTLPELIGFDYLNSEILKNSKYYNTNFLQNTYLEMLSE